MNAHKAGAYLFWLFFDGIIYAASAGAGIEFMQAVAVLVSVPLFFLLCWHLFLVALEQVSRALRRPDSPRTWRDLS